jgi:Zn-dependent peptidase ImmA (M78 family)/DNA-binding XRE family transcriptional regulator
MEFNPTRLRIARDRIGLTGKELGDLCGVTAQTVSNWETGLTSPSAEDIAKLVRVTGFPGDFFSLGDIELLADHAVSFRARTRLAARQKRAALAAGALAREFAAWIERRFTLPKVALPDLRGQPPELVADIIRAEWMLGDRPIPHMIRVLESRGVLVFSLAQDVKELDAFSFWSNGRPIVMLNTMKSAERSRVDAAHELMHLVAHKERTDKREEEAADHFAGALLMPKGDILRNMPRIPTLPFLKVQKRRWGVSLAAYVYRLHELKLISDWNYRTLFVELSSRGYRTSEPNAMPERESSAILSKVFKLLEQGHMKPAALARELRWHPNHLTQLVFNLGGPMLPVSGGRQPSSPQTPRSSKAILRAVDDDRRTKG